MVTTDVNIFDVIGERLDPHFYNPKYQNIIKNIQSSSFETLNNLVEFSTETWNQKDYFDEVFPYIEISSIDIASGELRDINEVDKSTAPSRAKKIVRCNDIIISTTRPNRGAITLLDIDDICIASTGFAVIRGLSKNIMREYLLIVLRQKCCLDQMLRRSSGGNYPAITESELKKILIPLPTIEVQGEIVRIYKEMQEVKRIKEQEIRNLINVTNAKIEKIILG